MSKHTQPTPEELEENQKNIEAELDELSKKHEAGETVDDPDEENKDPNEGDNNDDSGSSDSDDADDNSDDNSDADDKKDVKQVKQGEDQDGEEGDKDNEPSLKERYKNSTQESQILHAKNKKMNEAFKQVKNVPEPTEEDMTKEYGEEAWEEMSDFEKKMAKKDWKNDRRFEAINQIAVETEDAEAWSEKVDGFIDDPETLQKNPKLEGKVEEFKAFANKQSRRGVDFEDLTKAFLFDVEQSKPPKKKGKMFETGTGGDNKKVDNKPKKLTIEQSKALKKTNYSAWKEALMNNQIEDEF